MGERKILPVLGETKNNEIAVKNGVAETSVNLVDLRTDSKKSSGQTGGGGKEAPFFWLNAPKQSAWRQDFLKRMKKMDKPEDMVKGDEIAPLLAVEKTEITVSALDDEAAPKEKKVVSDAKISQILNQREVPQFVLKLVASNHTWAHRGWDKMETVIVGWAEAPWVRAGVLFFIFCWMVILPVKAGALKNQLVLGEKIFAGTHGATNSTAEKADVAAADWQTIKDDRASKRYLLVFQNENIARATGGAIESLALLDMADGKVSALENIAGGTEVLNKDLKLNLLPPEPLRAIETRWDLAGANWWPDFPASARKIAWFYENSGGATVDGVFAINKSAADGFGAEIVGRAWPDLLDTLTQSVAQRQAQIYFSDPRWEKSLQNQGWAGEIKETAKDYLMLVDTGLTGEDAVVSGAVISMADEVAPKADTGAVGEISSQAKLIQRAELRGEMQSDQSIINTLTLTLGGAVDNTSSSLDNWHYLRIYVPAGAILISSEGFGAFDQRNFATVSGGESQGAGSSTGGNEMAANGMISPRELTTDEDLAVRETGAYFNADGTRIYNEGGKTVFANWIKLTADDGQRIILKYQIAGNWGGAYQLYWQKQLGAAAFPLTGSLTSPEGAELWHWSGGDTAGDEVLGGE